MSVARLVLLLFLVAQGWDGVFTYIAVGAQGPMAEGNVLLATWMALIGPTPALLAAKLGASSCGVILYTFGVHRILASLTALYFVGAIGPWLVVLHYQ